MKFQFAKSKGRIKGIYILVSIMILLIFVNLNNLSNSTVDTPIGEHNADFISDLTIINEPKVSALEPNGKPLLVYQHSTITKNFFPLSLPYDVSFTLVEGWTSKNVTIIYDGISHQKDWVINGTFDAGEAPWEYFDNNTDFSKEIWKEVDNRDYVGIEITTSGVFSKGDFSYFEENLTIPEPSAASNTFARLSMDYYFKHSQGISSNNISLYVSIDIGGEKKNYTAKLIDLVKDYWTGMNPPLYDLTNFNQLIPGNNDNITVRVGVIVDNDTTTPAAKAQIIYFNNIQFTVWTQPNLPNLLIANDTEFKDIYNYNNSTFGKGSTFIDRSRSKSENTDIIFTISKNDTFTEELKVYNITITSEAEKIYNSTIYEQDGSLYTFDTNINWKTEINIDLLHYTYLNNWAEINKPSDWNITSILDSSGAEKIGTCTGTGFDSEKLLIPEGILISGKWILKSSSWNYISNGSLVVGPVYNEKSNITMGKSYRINVGLNHTLDLANTNISCTIEYPNGTIFYQNTSIPYSNEMNFGTHTVGKNMSVGTYQVNLVWTNNQSYLSRDKVGFLQFEFDVWHHTNLTAVISNETRVSGEPFLLKVNFTDSDLNTHIESSIDNFITITYNSTLPSNASGNMVYFGSGTYAADIDISGVDLGDYFFSFNSTNIYYEDQSMKDLIHLTIINQSLVVEISQSIINVNANSYATCNVSVTGAVSGTLIPNVSITIDWIKGFSIANNSDDTFTLTLSTSNLPTQGIVQTFTVTVFANKANYSSATGFFSISVHPLPAVVNVNASIINVYVNKSFQLIVKYTPEGLSDIISGATLGVIWELSSDIISTDDGFIISFSTLNLSLDTYTISLTLSHPGYKTVFKIIYVNILAIPTNVEILLNQNNQTSVIIPWNEPLNVTLSYKDSLTNNFISEATVELNGLGISEILSQNGSQYSVTLNSGDLPLGIHFLTVTSHKENFNLISSALEIRVIPIEIQVDSDTIEISDTLDIYAGESALIRIVLTEENTGNIIDNATVRYEWEYDEEEFENLGNGIYETTLDIPESAEGAYNVEIKITIQETQFAPRNLPISIYVLQKTPAPPPNYLFIGIVTALVSVVGVLGTLSLRSYVIVPRKRKKERIFQNTIQVFKDVKNIQAVMFIQRSSGMPFFNKNYASFDSKDNFLLSGFIQAITLFGEQMIAGETSEDRGRKHKEIYSKNIIELNFKFFHLLICDYQSVRSLLILREKASKRLKKQFYLLSVEIDAKLGDKIEIFKGKLEDFEVEVDILLNEFLSLYYSEPYKLIDDATYMQYLKKNRELQSIEVRLLNAIISKTKFEKKFTLNKIVEEIDEKNIDAIYGGLHTLIGRNIIVPFHYKKIDSHPLLGGFK